MLDRGRTEPTITVRQLFDTPETLSSCLLSGCKNFSRISRTGARTVCARDWGAELVCAADMPEGVTHIGVRAHYVRIVDGPEDNAFPCKLERVVEDVFSTVIMMDSPGGNRGFQRIRLEMPKEDWAALAGRETYWVRVAPEAIMLLRE